MVRDVQAASRKLCHRQLSWFRDERLFKWLEGDRPVDSIVDEIIADYSRPVNPGAPCHPPHASRAQAVDQPALYSTRALQARLPAALPGDFRGCQQVGVATTDSRLVWCLC